MELIFVETSEFKENTRILKKLFKSMSNPVTFLKALGMLLVFMFMYCSLLLLV